MKRRTFLGTAGLTVAGGLAGCSFFDDADEAKEAAEERVDAIATDYRERRQTFTERVTTIAEQPVWAEDEEAIREQADALRSEAGIYAVAVYEFTTSEEFVQFGQPSYFEMPEWLNRDSVTSAVRNLGDGETYHSETHQAITCSNGEAVALVTPATETTDRYLLFVQSMSWFIAGWDPQNTSFTQVVEVDNTILRQSNLIVGDNRGFVDNLLTAYATDESALAPIRKATDLDDGEVGSTVVDGNDQVFENQYAAGYAPVEGGEFVIVTHVEVDAV